MFHFFSKSLKGLILTAETQADQKISPMNRLPETTPEAGNQSISGNLAGRSIGRQRFRMRPRSRQHFFPFILPAPIPRKQEGGERWVEVQGGLQPALEQCLLVSTSCHEPSD